VIEGSIQAIYQRPLVEGLLRKPTAPAFMARLRHLSSGKAVMKMMGMRCRQEVSARRPDSRNCSADSKVRTSYPSDLDEVSRRLSEDLIVVDVEIVIGAKPTFPDRTIGSTRFLFRWLIGIYIAGMKPRNLPVQWEFASPHGVGGPSTVHSVIQQTRGIKAPRSQPLPMSRRGRHEAHQHWSRNPRGGRPKTRPPIAAIVNPPGCPGGFAVPAAMWHHHENREFYAGK
jgi:hypothetical protein